ncbi:hypothetical protein V5O48_019597, partial [Marasmius crinis-equi]
TVVMKKELTASILFSSMTVLEILRSQLMVLFGNITGIVAGKVSLDRVSDFLRYTELLDARASECLGSFVPTDRRHDIGFRKATFTWSGNLENTSSRPGFMIRIEDELIFKRGCVNLIV